jgi:hypothetical protein
MQTGLHAVGWGLQRLAVAAVAAVFLAVFAYAMLVFVLVAIQAAGTFGQ